MARFGDPYNSEYGDDAIVAATVTETRPFVLSEDFKVQARFRTAAELGNIMQRLRSGSGLRRK